MTMLVFVGCTFAAAYIVLFGAIFVTYIMGAWMARHKAKRRRRSGK